MMSLLETNHTMLPLLAASKLTPQMLMAVGAAVTVIVSMVTFSNWRLGVKIACVMVLFEGAVRKWVMPGAQELAYFTKDIFLIGAYLRFFFFPDPEMRAWRLRVPGGFLLVLCLIVSFSSLNPNIGSPILAAYGIKIYMFYLPLIFMVPFLFRNRVDLEKNIFWFAMLATPICLLGIAQYARPGDSSLNVMAHGGDGTSMGWEGAKIRVTGTFSYITGHTTFLVMFFALHMGLLLNKLPKWRFLCLLANLPLLAGNALMTGSRSTVMIFAAVGLGIVSVSMLMRVGDGSNAVLKTSAFMMVVMGVISLLFSEARSQWTARMQSSDDTFVFRVFSMPINSVGMAIKNGGMFGFGIGMTHPAQERLRTALKIPKPKRIATVFDVEVGQVLAELGLAGWIAWYVLRFIILGLTLVAFRESPPGLIKSLVLTSLIIQLPHMMFGVVLNHTANFLVFAFAGVGLIPLMVPTVRRKATPSNSAVTRSLPFPTQRESRLSPSRAAR